MKRAVLVAVLAAALVLAVLVWRRRRAARHTDGTFDAAAARVVRAARAPAAPPRARADAARVLAHTILAQEVAPPRGGARPRAVPPRHQRRIAMQEARQHLLAALTEARPPPLVLPAGAGDAAPPLRAPPAPAPQRLLQQTLDLVGLLFHMQFVDPDIPQHVLFDFGRPLVAAAAARQRESIVDRRAAAAAAPTPAAAATAFLEASKTHTSDDQNTHDTAVNAAARAIIAELRADPTPRVPLAQIAAQMDALAAQATGDERKRYDAALAVVRERVARGDVHLAAGGVTDAECLELVWARADNPRNAAQRDKIRAAVVAGLADSWEHGHITCVNGRLDRILGALALLDFDEKTWHMNTLEHYKNEIFDGVRRLIARAAEGAAASADPAVQAVGKSFQARTSAELAALGAIPEDAQKKFTDDTRAAIERAVGVEIDRLNERFPGTFIPEARASLIEECKAAV